MPSLQENEITPLFFDRIGWGGCSEKPPEKRKVLALMELLTY